jgi:dTDP-4-amino-4,6-dideoxygalactose transaminase
VEPSGKFVLTDLQASLGLAQLERLPGFLAARAAFAERYDDGLAELTGLRLPQRVPYDAKHAWHLYTVLVTRGGRAAFRKELRNRNIGTGLHFLPVHGLSYYRERYPDAASRLQQTDRVGEQIVSLPLFPDMTERDVDDVIAAVCSVLAERK